MGTFGEIDVFNHVVPPDFWTAWHKSDVWLSWQKTKGDSDIYIQNNTWQPGGTTGWHSHPGHSLIIITSGTVTNYESSDKNCRPHVYTPPQPSWMKVATTCTFRNETGAIATRYAVQLIPAVPPGELMRTTHRTASSSPEAHRFARRSRPSRLAGFGERPLSGKAPLENSVGQGRLQIANSGARRLKPSEGVGGLTCDRAFMIAAHGRRSIVRGCFACCRFAISVIATRVQSPSGRLRHAARSHGPPTTSTRYEDLTTLFTEWRRFQQPKRVDGVPDYSAPRWPPSSASSAAIMGRLAAIDPSGLADPAASGLLRRPRRDERPRLRSPRAQALGEQPGVLRDGVHGRERPAGARRPARGRRRRSVEVHVPAVAADVAAIQRRTAADSEAARAGEDESDGNQKDIWTYGAKAIKAQSADLAAFAAKLGGAQPDLKATVEQAKAATDALAAWLDGQAPSKTEPSGIGVDNYNWYLKNVQLVPYTWQEEVTLMERELARSSASLALEEQKNAKLPPQVPIASAAEHDQRFGAGGDRVHGVPEGPRHPDDSARHGSRPARAPRQLLARPARVLRRGRRARSRSDAHARLSLVRQGLDGARRPPEPGAQGARCSTTSSTRAPRASPRRSKN